MEEHIIWWNSLTIQRRDKLAQTYFDIENSEFLKDEEIKHIFDKVKNHVTLVNVKKEKKKNVIVKLPVLTPAEEKRRKELDAMTTILGLCQSLIYHFDLLPKDKKIFRHELKSTANNLVKELEKTMNVYFSLNHEEKFLQCDLLNTLCNSIEHNVKLAYRASEMDETTCDMFLKDYKILMNKYGIENDFLNENNEQK